LISAVFSAIASHNFLADPLVIRSCNFGFLGVEGADWAESEVSDEEGDTGFRDALSDGDDDGLSGFFS